MRYRLVGQVEGAEPEHGLGASTRGASPSNLDWRKQRRTATRVYPCKHGAISFSVARSARPWPSRMRFKFCPVRLEGPDAIWETSSRTIRTTWMGLWHGRSSRCCTRDSTRRRHANLMGQAKAAIDAALPLCPPVRSRPTSLFSSRWLIFGCLPAHNAIG